MTFCGHGKIEAVKNKQKCELEQKRPRRYGKELSALQVLMIYIPPRVAIHNSSSVWKKGGKKLEEAILNKV